MSLSITMAEAANQQLQYSADSSGSKSRTTAQEASSPSVPTGLPVTDQTCLSTTFISHKMLQSPVHLQLRRQWNTDNKSPFTLTSVKHMAMNTVSAEMQIPKLVT